jgi:hypothetical protein
MLRLLTAIALATVVLGSAGVARADDDDTARNQKGALGVGVVLGEPTGVAIKVYLKDDQAISVIAGPAFFKGGLQISADYLFHPYIFPPKPDYVLAFYTGPGLRLMNYGGDDGYFATGVRGVAGLLLDFKHAPIDVFVEAAGIAETGYSGGHGFGVALNAGAGVRYYF